MTAGYWVEQFTDAEREALAPYFTNSDGPVFALRNLSEATKGALFARYSRSGSSLRRLFLDEFLDEVAAGGEAAQGAGDRRAVALYGRVFDQYGDDSVAQLGGAHLACEQVSNVLTKVLEWGRLASYLEQSTRYVSYADRRDGRFRYRVDPAVDASDLGPVYREVIDRLFTVYAGALPVVEEYLGRALRRPDGSSEGAWRRALRARALDALRGLLPAATTSNLGIYASGQAYEALLLRLAASPLPEAQAYGELMLPELRQVIAPFLTRVDREDRGVAWARYLAGTANDTAKLVDAMRAPEQASDGAGVRGGPCVRLTAFDPEAEQKVLTAIAYPHASEDEQAVARQVAALGAGERAALFDAYVGERGNRRHRPGRALERALYTFEVVADYGAFRDLQRHRLCTIVWQPLSPALGYEVPGEVEEASLGDSFRASMAESAALHDALQPRFPAQAPYAVTLAHWVRFAMTMNARELMHLAELRSAPQGHPAYRAVAQQMHRLVAEEAGHRLIAGAMRFVVHDEPSLGRLEAEERSERRRQAL